MKFILITTQPKIYGSFLQTGLIARGILKKIIEVKIVNLYDFGQGKHRAIDDTPYGGGPGMIIRVDIVDKAISELKVKNSELRIILLTPQGKTFNQKVAKRLAKEKEIILIAGRFEGYDERIRGLVDEEISIGDYVLTSGDPAAIVLIDAIARHLPGFIEKKASLKEESFENNLLEFPQYTRPAEYCGKKVPETLLSGNHPEIAKWRKEQARKKTKTRRPDLTYLPTGKI